MKTAPAKAVLTVIFIFVGAVCGAAQNCDLSSRPAPLLLNLSIGASPEQTQSVFGKALQFKIKKSGERTLFRNYIKKPAPEPLRGVRALYLRFYDRKLYQIEVFYEISSGLNSLTTVVDALSAELNLPIAEWRIKNNRAEIKCANLSLVTDYILNSRVELIDEMVRDQIKEQRKAKKK